MEDATDEGQFPVSERTHQLKVSIKHFDGAKAEIGGIKECSISIRCNSQSFVDSPQTDIGPIHREDGMGRINLWIPARDGAVLCSKKNRLGAVTPFCVTAKLVVPLKTVPVGAAIVPAGLPAGGGMVTTNGTALP